MSDQFWVVVLLFIGSVCAVLTLFGLAYCLFDLFRYARAFWFNRNKF